MEKQVLEMLKQMNECMDRGFSTVNEKLDGIAGNLKKPQNN